MLGWTTQDDHLDSHAAPELCESGGKAELIYRGFASGGVTYLVFTHMPSDSYHRQLRSFLWVCDLFHALIISLVCWF